MVEDPGDFLGVSLEYRDHLFRVLVEDGGVAVVTSGQNLAGVRRVDVQRQDTRDTGTVEPLWSASTCGVGFQQ